MTANDDTPDHLKRPRDGRQRFVRSMDNVRRDAEAAAYWAEHHCTYQEIADRFGYYDRAQAWRGVQAAKRDVALPGAEKLRATEAEQLDALFVSAMEILEREHVMVSHGRVVKDDTGRPILDDGPRLAAVREMRQIRESYRKLFGLDAPSRVSVDAEKLGQEIGKLLDMAMDPEDASDDTDA
ncbi:hypothetical protein ACFW6E_08970 [Streptomyces olivaceoviridis]|uniref:hypothetical protein n=1 Tax=Streptomyces olivaceoviridis TaxID=1921 RepID=UPI00367BE1F6